MSSKLSTIFVLLAAMPTASLANVVVNGTFDNNSTAWVGAYGVGSGGSGGFPTIDTGNYYFAGSRAQNSITQFYDLTVDDLNDLATTGLNFNMSADLFAFSTQADHSIFTAAFYSGAGATGNLLGEVSLDSATNDPGAWGSAFIAGEQPNFQSASGVLSSQTSSILFTVESIRFNGSSNDGYADNVAFSLSPASAVVPVPAAVWLFASGLLGLVGLARKKV